MYLNVFLAAKLGFFVICCCIWLTAPTEKALCCGCECFREERSGKWWISSPQQMGGMCLICIDLGNKL